MVSIIIPTFRRPSSVVSNTIRSIVQDESSWSLVSELILIDQNSPTLELENDLIGKDYKKISSNELSNTEFISDSKILHITGLLPSVTKAKNFGEKFARGSIYVFFDDDVTVMAGAISNYVKLFESNLNITFLGGREILDQNVKQESKIKKILRSLVQDHSANEAQYCAKGVYVGRIKPNSFMIKNFNVDSQDLVRIDGARGCNWACRASAFKQAGGFDENYQGTALREETDLYLRLN